MKIAVTGAEGIIGRELVKRGCIPVRCDITQSNDLVGEINAINPDIMIHCAAITDVAYCEKHFDEAFEVNVRGTHNVVTSLHPNTVMIYISTDHVFHGDNWLNIGYGEWHKPQPVNNYGFTKWGGEIALQMGECRSVIVRTSRGYSYDLVRPTIHLLNRGEDIVFTNLIKRSFMYVDHFVVALLWLANNIRDMGNVEVVNIAGESVLSYSAFWQIVCNYLRLPGKVVARNQKIDESPRPFRAGLDITYARKLGVPLGGLNYALLDMKERIEHDNLAS